MSKKKLRSAVQRIDLGGSLVEAIKTLKELQNTYGSNTYLEMDYKDAWSESEEKVYFLYVEEEESDEVYQTRLKSEADYRARKEDYDRKMLAELKKMYE